MRKVLAFALIAVFSAAVGLAGTEGHGIDGTITKLDMAGKSMVVKTADGKETTVFWNESTKVKGSLKEGEAVHLKAADKDGKSWASFVVVGSQSTKKK